jgi:hypothetical protein
MNEIEHWTKAEIKRAFSRVTLVSVAVQRADDMCIRTSKKALVEAMDRYSDDAVYKVFIIEDGQGGEMVFFGFAEV